LSGLRAASACESLRACPSHASPSLTSEVGLDHAPELLGEIERLRAILWARLALRINRPDPKEDRLLGIEEAAAARHHKGLAPSPRGPDAVHRAALGRPGSIQREED